MKEGWEYKKIKDVGVVIGGTTPSTANPAFWNGNICWISPAELKGEHYLYDSAKKITEEAVSAKNLKELPIGTVILSSRAPIGKLAINKVPMYCNQGFKCIICGNELYNEYLYWWLYGKKDYLNSLGTGATFPEISKSVVENIQIPIPPLSEQHRIVEYLDTQFAKIDALKTNAEQQLQAAKDLFQSALKDLMTPMEGWEEKKLKDIGKTQTGCTPSKSNVSFYGDYMPFIRPAELNIDGIGGISYDSEIKLSKLGVQQCRLIRKDSILMCCIGSVGKTAYTTRDITCNQQINAITPYEEFNPRFVYYVLLSPRFQEEAIKIANSARATLAIISKGKWENIIVAIPPLYNQQYIANQLDSLSANIKSLQSNYEQTLTLCNDLKQSLLKKIFE